MGLNFLCPDIRILLHQQYQEIGALFLSLKIDLANTYIKVISITENLADSQIFQTESSLSMQQNTISDQFTLYLLSSFNSF